jgi:hypothetical protein
MPVNRHFGGHGEKVMKDMMERYGGKKAERVFYATEKKQAGKKKKGRKRRSSRPKASDQAAAFAKMGKD